MSLLNLPKYQNQRVSPHKDPHNSKKVLTGRIKAAILEKMLNNK